MVIRIFKAQLNNEGAAKVKDLLASYWWR